METPLAISWLKTHIKLTDWILNMLEHEWTGKRQDQHPQRITVKASYPEAPMSARACMFNQISMESEQKLLVCGEKLGIISWWGNHCHIIAAWASHLPEQTQANHFIICRAIQLKAQSHIGLRNHLSALIQAQVQSRSQVLGPLNRTTLRPFVLFLLIVSRKWTNWCECSQSHTAVLKPTNFVNLYSCLGLLQGQHRSLACLRSLEARPLPRSIRLHQNRGDQKPRSSHVGLLYGKSPKVLPDCKALLEHMSSHVMSKRCGGNAKASAPLPESSSAAAKNLVYPMPGKGATIECREVFWNKNCYQFHILKSWCTISMATR